MFSLIFEELVMGVHVPGGYIPAKDATLEQRIQHATNVLNYAEGNSINKWLMLEPADNTIVYTINSGTSDGVMVHYKDDSTEVYGDCNAEKVMADYITNIGYIDSFAESARNMFDMYMAIKTLQADKSKLLEACHEQGLYVSPIPADEEMSMIYDAYQRLKIESRVYREEFLLKPEWKDVFDVVTQYLNNLFYGKE